MLISLQSIYSSGTQTSVFIRRSAAVPVSKQYFLLEYLQRYLNTLFTIPNMDFSPLTTVLSGQVASYFQQTVFTG